MRLGLDVSALSAPNGGIGTYTHQLWEHLHLQDGIDVVPVAHRTVGDGPSSVQSPRPPLNKTLWMQAVLPWELRRLHVDVMHFTNHVASLWAPAPVVVTVHDMTLWLYPQHHYLRRMLAMRPIIPLALRRAAAVIAVSESTRRDIIRLLGLPPEKITVIHEAAAEQFRPLPPGQELEACRSRLQVPPRFVLHVGTIEPRKNLVRLLAAMRSLAGTLPHHLVLVGRRGWKDGEVFAAIETMGLADRVQYLGYVPQDDLVMLYNLADVVAFPSLHEGFGLPVAEAMACGVPVLTSAAGGLVEVAGQAAIFVDPTSVESIADGLLRLLTDADLRDALSSLGLRQSGHFRWEDAAAATKAVYRQVFTAAR